MTRLFAALSVLLALLATPSLAQWRTTQITPVPPDQFDLMSDEQGFGEDINFVLTSRDDLIKDAPNYFAELIPIVESDLKKLKDANFKHPISRPLMDEVLNDNLYIPIVWVNKTDPTAAPAGQTCEVRNSVIAGLVYLSQSEINNAYDFPRLERAWQSGGARRQQALDLISTLTIHELTHAIQNTSWTPKCEVSGLEKWIIEGTADAVAFYLFTKRRPTGLEDYPTARSKRDWTISMNKVTSNASIAYAVASFYRYLMEASEGGHNNGGLAVVKDIFDTNRTTLAADPVGELDKIITRYAGKDLKGGPRTLYNVLPEFLTEYASYGGSRYKTHRPTPSVTAALDHKTWLGDTFPDCDQNTATIDHSANASVDVVKMTVNALAGACLKVEWKGVKQPVTLQFFADNIPNHHGDLHIGQAVRKDSTGTDHCWSAIQGFNTRLEDVSVTKCILSRATPLVGSNKTPDTKVAMWNLDMPIEGSGEAYMIVSNIAAKPATSQDHTFEMTVGALNVDYQLAAVTPRAPAGTPPVERGLANLDARLHVFSGNGNRGLFDGRVIDGSGPDFDLPSDVFGNGADQGLLSFVRGSNYWVGVLSNEGAAQDPNDAAFIFKDPGGMETNFQTPGGLGTMPMMAIMQATPVSGGTIADIGRAQQCGRSFSPDIKIEAVTKKELVFMVEGDLFDMSRAMSSGATSGCGAIDAAFVERAKFTVSLPYGPLYDGSSTITPQMPPGQASHEANFPDGPAYGGIATARSYAEGGSGPTGLSGGSGGGGSGGGGSGGPSGGGSGGENTTGEICSCTCPRPAIALSASCSAQCKATWSACPATDMADLEPPRVRFDRLLDDSALTPGQRKLLGADFEALSPATQDYLLGR
ncbi:hypothetical protein [Oceanibium sediminis]|uniref:hypothetical protein n=1 Tax=Oceanibium sediminis TaxID=2026339 RepID=UPI000DD308B4|nr:hypothetical protein [Oceanibium sediminis]